MHNIVLKLAYDGTHYFGWQKTAMGPSIEEILQKVLEQIYNIPITLQAASRTDRGVHAEGQLINFQIPKKILYRQCILNLNALLPKDIRVLEMRQAEEHFHPTLDAIGKSYHYRLCLTPIQLPQQRYFSWHIPMPLDLNEMKKGAAFLEGEHDFSSFCNMRKNINYTDKIRRIDAIKWIEEPQNILRIEVSGNHFLYKMMRTLVGTLVYIGRGKLSAEEMLNILAAKARPRAGMTAPAHGLTLKEVYY